MELSRLDIGRFTAMLSSPAISAQLKSGTCVPPKLVERS
jgi:hypothetical protein